jgi:hypothetical protein
VPYIRRTGAPGGFTAGVVWRRWELSPLLSDGRGFSRAAKLQSGSALAAEVRLPSVTDILLLLKEYFYKLHSPY